MRCQARSSQSESDAQYITFEQGSLNAVSIDFKKGSRKGSRQPTFNPDRRLECYSKYTLNGDVQVWPLEVMRSIDRGRPALEFENECEFTAHFFLAEWNPLLG
jgi:hypothetical protein